MVFPRYKIWLLAGIVLGLLSVGLGAFGSHGLEARFKPDGFSAEELKKIANWETAVRYQMYHALALLALGTLAIRRCGVAIHAAGTAMTLGTLLFSGCLYGWVLDGPRFLVHIVPIGGILMILGWVLFAAAVWQFQTQEAEHREADSGREAS